MQLTVKVPDDRPSDLDPDTLFDERPSYVLLQAGRALPGPARLEFPTLRMVSEYASYIDESLWLDPQQIQRLADEFTNLVSIADRLAFSKNVTAGHLQLYWTEDPDNGLGQRERDSMRDVLAGAARRDCWGRFML